MTPSSSVAHRAARSRARQLTAAATVTAATFATVAGFSASPAAAAPPLVRATGPTFVYDSTLAPAGTSVQVSSTTGALTTVTSLKVSGLLPNRRYGSHVHYLPCGELPAAAGAHFQYVPDPATGGSKTVASTDPAYANPRNEIWLDFTTSASGSASSVSVVPWRMPADRRGQSVIIHAMGTDHTGAAGARVLCVDVPF
jgi:Cu-Zn family superoxide dismutase